LSEDDLLQERIDQLRETVREIRAELQAYKRNVFRAVLAAAGYLAYLALHSVPGLEVLFK
jgi:hypothetical protein